MLKMEELQNRLSSSYSSKCLIVFGHSGRNNHNNKQFNLNKIGETYSILVKDQNVNVKPESKVTWCHSFFEPFCCQSKKNEMIAFHMKGEYKIK